MSYELVGDKVFCQNDATRCVLKLWIGDKGVSIYRCPNCRESFRIKDNEFVEEKNDDI